MASKTLYYCPSNCGVVLFEDESEEEAFAAKIVVVDRPAECHKCGNHYYRHECKKDLEGTGNEAERKGH